jgi:cystine transport system substrate-binding protein
MDKPLNLKLQTSNFKRWLGTTVLLAVLGFGVWSWWFAVSRAREDEAWKRIRARGVITIATDASFPPFAAVDENGNLFGFDVDLADELARRLGVRAEFENIAYDALLSTLVSNRDDAVISAFVPQPGRLKEVIYTHAYFVAGTVAVIRAASPPLDADPLKWAAGKKLAVEYGAGGDALARQWAKRVVGITVLPKQTSVEAMQAVEDQQADAALVDLISAYDFLQGNSALRLAGKPLEPEPYVIAMNANSRELFTALEKTLGEMEADGTLAELKVKWFGEAANGR